MDVFLMIRRKKTTIFLDAKEDTSVQELKKMISGITKVKPDCQRLFKGSDIMKDDRTLGEYGLTSLSAKPQLPATIGLAFKDENGEWEDLVICPLSQPPELPEVMRAAPEPDVSAVAPPA